VPSNIVKPGQEAAWERAKKKAAEQGHEKDWPYIVAIFKKMRKSFAKSVTSGKKRPDVGDEFLLRQAKAEAKALGRGDDWAFITTLYQRMKKSLVKGYVVPVPHNQARTPGQVPGRERLPRELRRLTDKPPELSQARLERYDDIPVLRPEAAVRGLGFNAQEASRWAGFIAQTARTAANELTFRQIALDKFREEKLPVEVTKALLQRGLAYWRQIQKSFVYVEAVTVDELSKAVPRGGKYHRRVPKPGGGYNYVYDEASYQKRQDAHVDGEAANVAYVTNQVVKCVQAAGEGGCRPSALKPLVQKFGADKVAKILEDGAGGKISFKGGKFKLKKEPDSDKGGSSEKIQRGRGN